MTADETLDLLELLRGQTPAWWPQARCSGMGADFHALDHDAQRRVCEGCPVTVECIKDLFTRVEKYGMREMTDGDTVCGGLLPSEQRRLWIKSHHRQA